MTLVATLGLQLVSVGPASAAALTNVAWSVSKPHPGDTAVRYTWTFTTATTSDLTAVEFSVPAGTAGASLSVAGEFGMPSGGSASLSGTTVTYTLASTTNVAAGVQVQVALDGFTNTSTPGSYTSNVTTKNGGATVDGATASQSVSIDGNTTAVTVVIARSVSFTNDTDSFAMAMDPNLAATADQTKDVALQVKTNADNGYTLAVKAVGTGGGATLRSTGANTIGDISAGVGTGVAGGSFTVNRWGFSIPTITGVGTRTGAGHNGGADYVGYTTGGETTVTATGPTNQDDITLRNRVKVDHLQAADVYGSTVTYTVTPSY